MTGDSATIKYGSAVYWGSKTLSPPIPTIFPPIVMATIFFKEFGKEKKKALKI